MPQTKQIKITGRVQGVGYRDAMCVQAAQLGVTGWVRNRRDGSVEAVVSGEAHALQTIIEWVRRGPQFAVVAGVAVEDAEESFDAFEFRPTA